MYINISKVDFGRCYSGGSEYYGMFITPAGDSAISVTPNNSYYTLHGKYLKYSFDGKRWKNWTGNVSVQPGQKMYVKGEDDYVWTDSTYGKLITSTSYYNVGGDISSLTNEIVDVKNYTFSKLFYEDRYIKDASNLILPATTLAEWCYYGMFEGCSSLIIAPELPAMTLAPYCYQSMFRSCSSLTTAPELPATELAMQCYSWMFLYCSSLTTAPTLPATELTQQCYMWMFSDCTSLETAPALPATTLTMGCYDGMFEGCSSLTTAPELLATTLTELCYRNIFKNCSKLNSITMLATDISADDCLDDWVNGVAATGTFMKSYSMTSLPAGVSGIPSGWTVVDYTEYLTLSALGDGEITITIPSRVDATYATYLSYSKDKSNWTPTTIDSTEQTITIPVSSGDDVYLKGKAKQWANEYSSSKINSNCNIIASGNIMSLLYEDDFKDKTVFRAGSKYNLRGLFSANTHLINVENLILPATTLTPSCYYSMFYGCTSLTTAPELPATTLNSSCYFEMFYGCTSLTTAPELPATTLAQGCYYEMFYGCTSLTTAPELPATTLAQTCYYSMFYGCKNLNNITMLATDISVSNCLSNWVKGVSSTGTFVKSPSMTSIPEGTSGIPSGWTVVDYYPAEYLTLSALEDGEITITIPSYVNQNYATSLSYSKDKSNWTPTTIDSTNQTISIPVSTGDKVYLQGIALRWAITPGPPSSASINSTANIIASGNIMSLLYGEEFKDKTTFPNEAGFVFWELFKNNTHLINAENLILPATKLTQYCYYSMFDGCTSLTTAPELPATVLASYCYQGMFYRCGKLNSITMLATDISAPGCLSGWVNGVSSTGTFTKAAATTLPTGSSGIPSGWTVVNK